MEYKGYIGQFTFNVRMETFYGKVSNIESFIIFQGKSMEALEQAFHVAIDKHLDWCKKNGKDPEKPSPKNNSFYYGP